MYKLSPVLLCTVAGLATYISETALPALAQTTWGNFTTGATVGAVIATLPPCPPNLLNTDAGAIGDNVGDAQNNCQAIILKLSPYTNWASQCNACGGTINAPIQYGPPNYTQNPGDVTVYCIIQTAQCVAP